ncbi:M48 family metallopeptidase [Flectobacillus sp. BAB-3569]|uniref:M48 family metallopeptidase n=1 Tax=Flectobacillus sp. BAB-3569 TaxID=1509483 RepID=UPI000BA32C6D|nr:M48 family metallopeptidase [Flectobacillus sp. BAB-3569]PAC30766.1 peptidase M48 [Flectobacillus sp. BAB-3569]
MKRILLYIPLVVAGLVWACSSVPITGRKQFLLVSDDEMNSMALTSYKQFLDTNKVISPTTQQAAMVKKVGDKIAKAAQQYFEQTGNPNYLQGYQWQTELVQSSEVNAWCMPGGKMVVYTGILPVTQNETGLAVVMGHEVSHAIAKHGAERMSQGMFAQGLLAVGQAGLSVAMKDKPQATQSLWNNVFGVAAPIGAQVTLLAYGRGQESEADHLGLIFMSMAGYDPNEAIGFWGRMAKLGSGSKPPKILSTHPTDEQRIADIKRLLPEALKYYRPAGSGGMQRN